MFQSTPGTGHNMVQIVVKRKVVLVLVVLLIVYFIYSTRDTNQEQFPKLEPKLRLWFDEKLLDQDSRRAGPGEQGKEVILTDELEIARNDELYQKTGFSVVVSDKISLKRSLPRVVHPDCSRIEYNVDLPKVSVIIIFHNEVKSVLLRTVWSVINRTPVELLHEIILVNDNSTNEDLYQPLQDYVQHNFNKKVRIKNLHKRSGLIVTRMEGAREATGEVLVFFDSHIEVHLNWLPPLLQPIVDNRRISTLPIVDYFDAFTFGYLDGQESFQGSRGVIDWYMDFHELPKLPDDAKHDLRPFPNPIMLGAAFAIDRKFFLDELGGYDEGLQIWNGENYELSFKLWMCADGILTVPCSRVAHSFRSINPSRIRSDDYVARNFMRVAGVWMDQFKDLPKQLEPKRYANVDPGNLTKQLNLRRKLNCKSFQWFLASVAPDMVDIYPPYVYEPRFASGAVQSIANPRLCLDNFGQLFGEKLGLVECANDLLEPGVNQKFVYSFFKDLRQDHGRHEYCLDAWGLSMSQCNQLPYGNQFWIYEKV